MLNVSNGCEYKDLGTLLHAMATCQLREVWVPLWTLVECKWSRFSCTWL